MFRSLTTLVLTTILASSVSAGELRPYDAAAFAAAQVRNAPIIIHVTAPWCPTCQAQRPIVQSLADDPSKPDLIVFDVDFDSQKDVLQTFGVRQQSTLIAFRGVEERTRAVGITDPAAIAALFGATD